jgi:hypothetical protein
VAPSNSSTGAWRLGLRTRGMTGIVHATGVRHPDCPFSLARASPSGDRC